MEVHALELLRQDLRPTSRGSAEVDDSFDSLKEVELLVEVEKLAWEQESVRSASCTSVERTLYADRAR